jgi:mRNA interferase HigB
MPNRLLGVGTRLCEEVFNIAGNKVRPIAALHYNRNKIYFRHVLTHQEYDTGKWKK